MIPEVLLVDDHPIVRAGLRAVLESDPAIRVVGEAGTGEEAVAVAAVLRPHVVLCDLRLSGGMDAMKTTRALRNQDPAPAVLILTTFDRDADILRAVEAGASGYLLKDTPTATILSGIRDAAAGRTVLAPEISTRIEGPRSESRMRLAERELELLALVEEGRSDREIARALFVSEATVRTNIVHILSKLAVESRARAVAVARQIGLLY